MHAIVGGYRMHAILGRLPPFLRLRQRARRRPVNPRHDAHRVGAVKAARPRQAPPRQVKGHNPTQARTPALGKPLLAR
eukprot:4743028-Prymnesium_polylepis.1